MKQTCGSTRQCGQHNTYNLYHKVRLAISLMASLSHEKGTEWDLEQGLLQYIKNNAWVTVNNDVVVMSGGICQWFSQVTKSRVKIIGISPHEWPKNRYSRYRMYYFISYTLFYILNTPFRYKQSSIGHFAIVAKDGLFWLNIVTSSQLICDVARTRGTGIVTSYSSMVLARANWRKGDIH